MDDLEQYDEHRERFKRIVSKKFDTTMIFAIAEFERNFSHLWGYDKPTDQLTEEEYNNRLRWKETRAKILDTGNKQKRNFENECSINTIIWNRYQVTLMVENRNPKESGEQ